MRLLEYEGKSVFDQSGIDVPSGEVVESPSEAEDVCAKVGPPVMLKAQVPTGGRGKAGGIVSADSPEETRREAERLLNGSLSGNPVDQLLVEEQLNIEEELYCGLIVDTSAGEVKYLFSRQGGVDIEQIAENNPEALHETTIDLNRGFPAYQAMNVMRKSGFSGSLLKELAGVSSSLYHAFNTHDMIMVEINPLVITEEERVIAADSVVELDDNSLFRNPSFDKDSPRSRLGDRLEKEAFDLGVNSFVKLDGEVGIVASGAGLGMATMDILSNHGSGPANFLETGGNISTELIDGSLKLVSQHENVRGIIVNLYGGINPMVDAAEGVVKAVHEGLGNLPVVTKLLGNQQEEAWGLLEEAGLPVVKTVYTEDAVQQLLEVIGEET